MADILRTTRDEEGRRREDTTAYQMQQQIDDLRRQLRDALARQQWLEDLYKNTEGQVLQLQMLQERHTQDVAQSMQVRQIEDGRLKQQIAELGQKVEEPMKPIRDLRAQIAELIEARRMDRERTVTDSRQYESLQSQIRQLVSQIGVIADAQRQLRDLVHELDAVNSETRQEIQRVAELQRIEEQRLRRQGVELQQMVESLREQFTEINSRSQRVDDVRRQLMEHIEGLRAQLNDSGDHSTRFDSLIQRLEKQVLENHTLVQERAETIRGQLAAELVELRQMGDQRMDRHITRFQQLEERIRELDGRLAEIPPHFETLRRRDEEIESVLDVLEERHLRMELQSIESQIEDMRLRRNKKQTEATQKATLVRNVRDARPHPATPEGSGEES
jgi:chromosome segregation ATPase